MVKTFACIGLLAIAMAAQAQVDSHTSSLYAVEDAASAQNMPANFAPASRPGIDDRLAPAIARNSLSAVLPPAKRTFAVHDLITIVIRESTSTSWGAELNTEKGFEMDGEIGAFPRIFLNEGIRIEPNVFPNGTPAWNMKHGTEFDGEGDYARKETMEARVQARVIDVKPNGTIVLEARKFIRSDKEQFNLVVTGTCRADDVQTDNSILSSKIYDLHVDKQHKGELKEATKKGILTKVFEFLFAF